MNRTAESATLPDVGNAAPLTRGSRRPRRSAGYPGAELLDDSDGMVRQQDLEPPSSSGPTAGPPNRCREEELGQPDLRLSDAELVLKLAANAEKEKQINAEKDKIEEQLREVEAEKVSFQRELTRRQLGEANLDKAAATTANALAEGIILQYEGEHLRALEILDGAVAALAAAQKHAAETLGRLDASREAAKGKHKVMEDACKLVYDLQRQLSELGASTANGSASRA